MSPGRAVVHAHALAKVVDEMVDQVASWSVVAEHNEDGPREVGAGAVDVADVLDGETHGREVVPQGLFPDGEGASRLVVGVDHKGHLVRGGGHHWIGPTLQPCDHVGIQRFTRHRQVPGIERQQRDPPSAGGVGPVSSGPPAVVVAMSVPHETRRIAAGHKQHRTRALGGDLGPAEQVVEARRTSGRIAP